MTTTKCCPDCDSLDVAARVRLGGYRCKACGWTGDDPATREGPERTSPLPGLAGELDAMDADAVGGDG